MTGIGLRLRLPAGAATLGLVSIGLCSVSSLGILGRRYIRLECSWRKRLRRSGGGFGTGVSAMPVGSIFCPSLVFIIQLYFSQKGYKNQQKAFSIFTQVSSNRLSKALLVDFLAFLSSSSSSCSFCSIQPTIFAIFLLVDSLYFLFPSNSEYSLASSFSIVSVSWFTQSYLFFFWSRRVSWRSATFFPSFSLMPQILSQFSAVLSCIAWQMPNSFSSAYLVHSSISSLHRIFSASTQFRNSSSILIISQLTFLSTSFLLLSRTSACSRRLITLSFSSVQVCSEEAIDCDSFQDSWESSVEICYCFWDFQRSRFLENAVNFQASLWVGEVIIFGLIFIEYVYLNCSHFQIANRASPHNKQCQIISITYIDDQFCFLISLVLRGFQTTLQSRQVKFCVVLNQLSRQCLWKAWRQAPSSILHTKLGSFLAMQSMQIDVSSFLQISQLPWVPSLAQLAITFHFTSLKIGALWGWVQTFACICFWLSKIYIMVDGANSIYMGQWILWNPHPKGENTKNKNQILSSITSSIFNPPFARSLTLKIPISSISRNAYKTSPRTNFPWTHSLSWMRYCVEMPPWSLMMFMRMRQNYGRYSCHSQPDSCEYLCQVLVISYIEIGCYGQSYRARVRMFSSLRTSLVKADIFLHAYWMASLVNRFDFISRSSIIFCTSVCEQGLKTSRLVPMRDTNLGCRRSGKSIVLAIIIKQSRVSLILLHSNKLYKTI